MISNNVPTTAPLITATLTESSSLSLDGSYIGYNCHCTNNTQLHDALLFIQQY